VSLNILHKIIRKAFLYTGLKDIDKIYPVVPAGFVFLNEVYGIPYEKMELLPLGCNMDKVDEVRRQNKGKIIRHNLHIPDDAFVVFTGGKLDPVKRTDLLIESFLKLSYPNVHLIIAGTFREEYVAYKLKIEQMIKNNKQIHFTGWLNGEEVYDYMNASDIAVFPASQSVLWQQSIGMGLPLILGTITKINGKIFVQGADYLNINNNIIFLDKNKTSDIEIISEISKIIKKLIKDPLLMKRMREGAIKTAEEFLDYAIIARKTLE
jgi:glycosyltransferase involved in cell wall biosynthesis